MSAHVFGIVREERYFKLQLTRWRKSAPASYPRFDPQASYTDEVEKLGFGEPRRTSQGLNKCYAKHRLCTLTMLWFIPSKRYITLKNRDVGKCIIMQDKQTERPDLEPHCLTRNLTLHSSTNTASGNIVTFSTLSPLHQFPFAQKTGSPL